MTTTDNLGRYVARLRSGHLIDPFIASGCQMPPRGWRWAWVPECALVTQRWAMEDVVTQARRGPGHHTWYLVLERKPDVT